MLNRVLYPVHLLAATTLDAANNSVGAPGKQSKGAAAAAATAAAAAAGASSVEQPGGSSGPCLMYHLLLRSRDVQQGLPWHAAESVQLVGVGAQVRQSAVD